MSFLSKEASIEIIRDVLSKGLSFRLKLYGGSMFPYIKNNTEVIIRKNEFNKINIGEIVIFETSKKNIAHRVLKNNNQYLITKGDNEFNNDGMVSEKQYIGSVVGIIKNQKIKYLKYNIFSENYLFAKLSYILSSLNRLFYKFYYLFK